MRGKRVFVTGVTGFLGQAVLERLLHDAPEVRVFLLVLARGGQSPRSRINELFTKPAFNRLREREGAEGIKRIIDDRIEILEGDVESELPDLPSDIDIVFHCAATVVFDPPIDEAFRTNVLGALALYEAVARSGSNPHLVHVSTDYVFDGARADRGVVWSRSRGSRSCSTGFFLARGANTAEPDQRSSRSTPRNAEGRGFASGSSSTGGRGPRRSAGPTSTR